MKKILTTTLLCSILFIGTTTIIAQTTTQRVPIYEIFTSSTCAPCNPGNSNFMSFMNSSNEAAITYVRYQVDWPGVGDPYYHEDVQSRRSYYGVSAVPDMYIDGQPGPFITNMTQSDIDGSLTDPSIVKLDAFYQINESTQTVDIQVEIETLDNFPGGVYLRTAIFEYQTSNNVGSNGETNFYHVMKRMIPSAAGTYIGSGWVEGTTETFNLSYTFNGTYILPPDANSPVDHSINHTVEEFSDLGVVVWLQTPGSKVVYQSTYALLGFSGVEEDESTLYSAKIYPNPAADNATIAFQMTGGSDVKIEIIDYTGKIMSQKLIKDVTEDRTTVIVDTKDFPNGIYLVRISSDTGEINKKLSIQR